MCFYHLQSGGVRKTPKIPLFGALNVIPHRLSTFCFQSLQLLSAARKESVTLPPPTGGPLEQTEPGSAT